MACISPQSSFSSVAIEDWLQVPKLTVPFPDFKDTDFKYRFWLTRHIMNDPESTSAWLATIEGKESDEDMWLWEDVDEEFIKAALRPFPGDCEVKFPELDWVLACNALAARNLRTPTQKLLTHLSSQTRIRIISWFIFAGPWRRERLRRGDPQSLDTLIERWGNLLYIGTELYIGNVSAIAYGNCRNCRASHFVPLWVETMLEVCFLDDLKLIPWSAGCACFEK
ncbi:hypothetical protein FB451DRAFT_52505 [Mycena latifolia]|nr:hypothetical protein FB451DRAFT_52505 [Mycena latifolia]